jgi:hypothetical protein
MIATMFKDFFDTTTPYFIEVDKVLKRMKDQHLIERINDLRTEPNKEERERKKKMLPCICFSGKFTTRVDKSITEHSGFAIMDFDKLSDPVTFRDALKEYPYIYSSFISPSGTGVKALVRIPIDIKKHRGYYEGLLRVFPDADPTSRNISRICYESCDPDLWINKEAIIFDTYIDVKQEQKEIKANGSVKAITTNYAKVNIALEMIRKSVDGNKHETLLKASKLIGGYISSGAVDENEAFRLMEYEISLKNVFDMDAARKTINNGITYGKQYPIEVIQYEKWKPIKYEIPLNIVNNGENPLHFLATRADMDDYLMQWRNGTFQMGLSTGIPSLDKYFRFKRGNFNVFNGFDNVGKSTTIWYLALLSSLYHGWKWLIYSSENKHASITKKLIEFYWGEKAPTMSELKFNTAYDFVYEHFKIIKNEKMYNFKDMLSMTETTMQHIKIDGVLLDPYNSLKIDLADNSKLNTHEYHYEAASEMQLFAKKHDICVYLNCHVVTSAMRMKLPPSKADTEGGGKFANKADDFITIHRELQDPAKWMSTELHVRKIKEIETGGGYTPLEAPFVLTMQNGLCRFVDSNGLDPVLVWHQQKGTPIPMKFELNTPTMQPNTSFDSEAKPSSMKDEPYYKEPESIDEMYDKANDINKW